MNHLPRKSLNRAAVCAGALALTLATCSACVGSSSPSGVSSSATSGGGAATSPGASSPATGGGGNGSTSSGTTGGGATGAATTSGSGGAGASGGGPQACETQNLSASVADNAGGAAAGSDYVDIVFKNIGDSACTLYGYPGVSFGVGSPVQQVGQPASRNPQVSPLIVTLIPNAHAFSVLRIADAENYPANDCDPKAATYLRVYPPNNNTLLYVPLSSTACASNVVTLSVETVQPGTGA